MRRALLAISAAAGILLTIDKIAGSPLLPGKDTHFEYCSEGRNVLLFQSDVGDLSCLILLRLDNSSPAKLPLAVSLSNGRTLSSATEFIDGVDWVTISDSPTKPQEKFDWPGGVRLRLSSQGTGLVTSNIVDWRVYPKDGAYDSMTRARRRRIWWWISLGCLVLSIIGTVVTAIPEVVKKQKLTADGCLLSLIGEMEGTKTAKTKEIKDYLRQVVEKRVPSKAVMESMKASLGRNRAYQVAFTAHHQFRNRLVQLTSDLAKRLSEIMQDSDP